MSQAKTTPAPSRAYVQQGPVLATLTAAAIGFPRSLTTAGAPGPQPAAAFTPLLLLHSAIFPSLLPVTQSEPARKDHVADASPLLLGRALIGHLPLLIFIGRAIESCPASATRKTHWPSEGVGHAFLLLELLRGVAKVEGWCVGPFPTPWREKRPAGWLAAELYWKRLGAEKKRQPTGPAPVTVSYFRTDACCPFLFCAQSPAIHACAQRSHTSGPSFGIGKV